MTVEFSSQSKYLTVWDDGFATKTLDLCTGTKLFDWPRATTVTSAATSLNY